MGRVLTNNTALIVNRETALGVAGTAWAQLETEPVTTFGATITNTERNPISKKKQRRKGTTTDLDSAVEFPHDLTVSVFREFIEAAVAAVGVNFDVTQTTTAVDGTLNDYTVASLSAAVADKLEFSAGEFATLIFARGHTNAANNGLKELDTDVVAAATAISVTDTGLVAETPPANAQIELAGLRFLDATTDLTFAFSGTTITLTVGAGIIGFDWNDFGLTPGQAVHLGSDDGTNTIQNAFQNLAANDQFGEATLVSLTPTILTLDGAATALQNDSPTIPAIIDVMFGTFVRNVPSDSVEFLERTHHFEESFPNLDTGGNDKFQYAKGNTLNTMALALPLTDKASMTLAFIGTDTDNPVVEGSRKTGASAAVAPNATAAYNTSADFARLRIAQIDETGLTSDFKSVTITLGQNVSPEKVLAQLGAKFINTGNFIVDVEAQILFTESAVIDAIRGNTTVTMFFGIINDDAAIYFDIPSMTLGGGGRDFPLNETVLLNLTTQAFEDDVLETSIGVTIIPGIPKPIA